MPRKWTNESFLQFVKENSNCTLLSEVKGFKYKVTLVCSCGNEFEATVEKFVLRNKRQCNDCGRQKTIEGKRYTFSFVKEFIEHNSECSLLDDYYVGIAEPLNLKCGCGEIFQTTFDYFKNGNKRTCNICAEKQRKESLSYSYEEVKIFIESKKCKLLSRKYDDVKSPLTIQCECGESFKTSFDSFKAKNKTRCDKCSGKQSLGEIKIEKWLMDNKIPFKRQYRFKDCKYKKPLPFDFAVFSDDGNLKMLIEYDGEQHFHPYRFKDSQVFEYEKLKGLKQRDEIKNRFCKENNIHLLRIPYTELNHIEKVLENTL